jgi:TPR repeat protein
VQSTCSRAPHEALFKDPPAKEDCPICFLPMPLSLICCISLPPATIRSVRISDYAEENEELAEKQTEKFYSCCGKSICSGCIYSFCKSGNIGKCPFCNSMIGGITNDESVEDLKKRVDVNNAGAIFMLGNLYEEGVRGVQQDYAKAMELYTRAADLGYSKAHHHLGNFYDEGGDLKKAKFHMEAAAMAGDEVARSILGTMEAQFRNMERAVKHWMIAASAGSYDAMDNLLIAFNKGLVSRNAMDSTLAAYNNACGEMRSEARDAYMHSRSN